MIFERIGTVASWTLEFYIAFFHNDKLQKWSLPGFSGGIHFPNFLSNKLFKKERSIWKFMLGKSQVCWAKPKLSMSGPLEQMRSHFCKRLSLTVYLTQWFLFALASHLLPHLHCCLPSLSPSHFASFGQRTPQFANWVCCSWGIWRENCLQISN